MAADVVGFGAWCDLVTADDHRQKLQGWAALPDEVDETIEPDDRQPRPAAWRPSPDEIETEVRRFRRGISFRAVEFATLADGRRLTVDEREWSESGPPPDELWAARNCETMRAEVRMLLDEHDWNGLAEHLRSQGVDVSAGELVDLPYTVELSERLRARLDG